MSEWHLPWYFLPVLFSSAEQQIFYIVKNMQHMCKLLFMLIMTRSIWVEELDVLIRRGRLLVDPFYIFIGFLCKMPNVEMQLNT
jgi:hypothetical protein